MKVLALLVAALLWAESPPKPAARPAPTRPGLSWADADSLAKKLEAIQRRPSGGKGRDESVLVTQAELNSYLNLSLASELPQGLNDVDVRLEPDRIAATGMVDLDKVKAQVKVSGPLNPLSYLGGLVPVLIRGRLRNQDGFGSMEFETVQLGGFSLPLSLLAQLVASSTRSQSLPQGFDIQAPFRLPYDVKRVRIEAGRASLEL